MAAQIISLTSRRATLNPEATLLGALPQHPNAAHIVARLVEEARRSIVWLLREGYTPTQAAEAIQYSTLYAPLYQTFGSQADLPLLKDAAEQVASALTRGESAV